MKLFAWQNKNRKNQGYCIPDTVLVCGIVFTKITFGWQGLWSTQYQKDGIYHFELPLGFYFISYLPWLTQRSQIDYYTDSLKCGWCIPNLFCGFNLLPNALYGIMHYKQLERSND